MRVWFLYEYMCVHIHIYVYMYIYIYMFMFLYIYICTCIYNIYIYMYMYIYLYIYVCIHWIYSVRGAIVGKKKMCVLFPTKEYVYTYNPVHKIIWKFYKVLE